MKKIEYYFEPQKYEDLKKEIFEIISKEFINFMEIALGKIDLNKLKKILN